MSFSGSSCSHTVVFKDGFDKFHEYDLADVDVGRARNVSGLMVVMRDITLPWWWPCWPGSTKRYMMLQRRSHRMKYLPNTFFFPGGHYDRTDYNSRVTAVRELYEEAGVCGGQQIGPFMYHQRKANDYYVMLLKDPEYSDEKITQFEISPVDDIMDDLPEGTLKGPYGHVWVPLDMIDEYANFNKSCVRVMPRLKFHAGKAYRHFANIMDEKHEYFVDASIVGQHLGQYRKRGMRPVDDLTINLRYLQLKDPNFVVPSRATRALGNGKATERSQSKRRSASSSAIRRREPRAESVRRHAAAEA